jgi:YHS domain-containing protein
MKMKSLQTIIVAFAVAMLLVVSAVGDETKQEAKAPEVKAPETKAPEKETVKELKNQTNCPVMGGKIDSTSYADIQGQRVYFCCPMCEKGLRKDPDKYFKKAAEEGVLFENVQTFCPVSGEKLENKDVYIDYEGRRVYLCCKGCTKAFEKDPSKFLAKLDEEPKPDTEKQEKTEATVDHSGHDHH